jgi:hypothetical protein
MYASFFEGLTFVWVPLSATLFFLAFFTAVLLRVMVFGKREDPMAFLPMGDEEGRS